MQIVETTNEGLKRAYTLKIPAKEIEARIDAEVKKVAPQVRMPGFRPGKVPANLIRKMHGEALHSDALNASLRESIDTLMREKKLRPALQPKVDLDARLRRRARMPSSRSKSKCCPRSRRLRSTASSSSG